MVGRDKKRIQVTVRKDLLEKYYFLKGEKISLSDIFEIALQDFLNGLH